VLCGVSNGLSLVKGLEGSKEVDCWAVRMLGYDGVWSGVVRSGDMCVGWIQWIKMGMDDAAWLSEGYTDQVLLSWTSEER
jgi:hypothetical protein